MISIGRPAWKEDFVRIIPRPPNVQETKVSQCSEKTQLTEDRRSERQEKAREGKGCLLSRGDYGSPDLKMSRHLEVWGTVVTKHRRRHPFSIMMKKEEVYSVRDFGRKRCRDRMSMSDHRVKETRDYCKRRFRFRRRPLVTFTVPIKRK